MSGWLKIIGLGPGAEAQITPEVQAALAAATDAIGYIPYIARLAERPGLTKHASDNRVEVERATHALQLTEAGHKVVVVSSGDPGVFAMAAAVFEVIEQDPARWAHLDIAVLPGLTAMLAAAARFGAPMGHDFCAINLSDNLKPWAVIEQRLRLAAEADFVMGFYNPRSKARPEGFSRTLEVLRKSCAEDRLVLFARAVSTPQESLRVETLSSAQANMADMSTMVIVGSSQTRTINRGTQAAFVYTPRTVSP